VTTFARSCSTRERRPRKSSINYSKSLKGGVKSVSRISTSFLVYQLITPIRNGAGVIFAAPLSAESVTVIYSIFQIPVPSKKEGSCLQLEKKSISESSLDA